MGIFDKIQWLLNPAVIEVFEDLYKNHFTALDKYIKGQYEPRSLVELPEDKKFFQQYDLNYKEIADCLYKDWVNKDYGTNSVKLSFKQKEYIVNHKSEILDLYNRFAKYNRVTEDCVRCFNEYPHAVAFFCNKLFDVYMSSVDMPMYSIDGQGNVDATIFCALMLKKHIKSVYELTYLQKNELLNYKESFSTREKMILEQIKDNKICSDFEIDILSNVERQIYYKEFLLEHKIYNHKLISSKQYCLKNLEALDSFIKEELIFQDLLDVFGEVEITDYLHSFYKNRPENLSRIRIKNIPHIDKKFLVENYEDVANFIKAKIHERYNKLSEEFPLGMESFKQSVDNIIYDYLVIDGPTPIIRENSREWWKEKFRKALISECNKYELEIWYNHKDLFAINIILNKNQEEAEKCKKFKEWNKKQFLFLSQCNELKTHYLEWWLKSTKKIINCTTSDAKKNASDNYFSAHHLSYKPFCSDENFDISPYPFVASAGELRYALVGIKAIPNSALVELGNYLIELNKHKHPIAISFHLSAVNKDKIDNLIEFHFAFLIKLLSDNGISVYKNLNELQVLENQAVIIIDLISTRKETREFIEEFIRKHEDKLPLLSYVSFYYEITSQNIIRLAELREQKKNEAARIKKEQEEKQVQERQTLVNCVSSWYNIGLASMKCFSMYNYYPTTCDFEATNEEWNIRKLIWNFKANKGGALSNASAMSKIVPDVLQCLSYFFGEHLSKLTFVCIPASTSHITNLRYEKFSQEICKFTGMENGYSHITIEADGEAKHTGGKTKAQYKLDANFFKNKYILLFDDVITKGNSMYEFKRKLENLGAIVIGGLSIGVTKHERLPDNPIDKLDLPELNVKIPNYLLEILPLDELPF